MAIRLFGEDRAFFTNDLEGPMHKPIVRITRRGVGGAKVIADDPISIVYYAGERVPVLTGGRNISVADERQFELQSADLLPVAPNRLAMATSGFFNTLAGRIGITRGFQSTRGRRFNG